MPRNHPAPRCALLAAFDARRWSAVEVFKRGAEADPVTLPAYGDGEGVYLDAIDFACGFGSARPFNASVAGNGVTFALVDDRLVVTNAGDDDVTLAASAGNAWWGLPTGATLIDKEGGTLTAAADWRRGMVTSGSGEVPPRLVFTVDGVIGIKVAPPTKGWMQSVIVGLRERGEVGGLDDTAAGSTLEDLDNAVNDAASLGFRWGITDDGFAFWTGTSAAAAEGVTWLSTTFRDRLGFTGLEPIIRDDGLTAPGFSAGVMYGQIAARPMPGVVVPSRPPQRLIEWGRSYGDAVELVDGRAGSVLHAAAAGVRIDLLIDGYHDSALGGLDLHRHLRKMLSGDHDAGELALAGPGEPLTLYQDVGDTRRALAAEVATADQPLYDLNYTAESNGWRGRRLCRVSADSDRELAADSGRPFRRRFPVTLTLSHRERGV